MTKRKSKEARQRKKPLIKRVLVMPQDIGIEIHTYNWGVVHVAGSAKEAADMLNNYSYDAIIIGQDGVSPEIMGILATKYQYDSIIVFHGKIPGPSWVQDAEQLTNAKYTVMRTDELSNIACNGDEMVRDVWGKE